MTYLIKTNFNDFTYNALAGRKPFPYQLEIARQILNTSHHVYLAGDAGIGKTIIASIILDVDKLLPSVVVCPPFLVRNWKEEILRWANFNPTDIVTVTDTKTPLEKTARVFVIPDTRLDQENVRRFLFTNKFNYLFIDESHRYKTPTAVRTKSLFGGVKTSKTQVGERKIKLNSVVPQFKKAVAMSGTPMPNRPRELWPVLNALYPNPNQFKSFHWYGVEFCGGFETRWGFDYNGSSNLDKLKKLLDGFMIRVTKDVLDLPDRLLEVVYTNGETKKIKALENLTLEKVSISEIIANPDRVLGDLATYRKEVGLSKVADAINFIKDKLDNTDESLVVFAYHKDVLRQLMLAFSDKNPLLIDGSVATDKRQDVVKLFQTNSNYRLLFGQIEACGVGFTLTKASHCLFVEYDWTPAKNSQAIDRLHRIGQTNTVTATFLVLPNLLDEYILQANIKKLKTINQTIE